MSLLKEGNGVNFQRASCTLDGCVKIYTNRVDSVATETSKLLTGLADNSNNRRKGEDGEEGEDGEDGEDGEEGEDGSRKKSRKRVRLRIAARLLLTGTGPTIFRSDARNLLHATPTQKNGARVCHRSSVQEGIRRLR